ncbi:MAG TPA: NrsF family protein [Alphaproteobacteria bacterium]|jgi:hypothetical protein|nr:NrsF family protein [Alphaproteobacteria bacterium]
MSSTDGLIAELTGSLQPVKRLRSPYARAALWLGVIAILGAIFVAGFADMPTFMRRAGNPRLGLELAATLVTGVLAVLAAFMLSLPDRPLGWMLLPVPSFLLWVGSSSYSCWRQWIVRGRDGLGIGEGLDCFAWIVAFGIPLGISLFLLLRRAKPLAPAPVAAMGGLGAASIAAFLLQFFHPFDVTFIDLGMHFAAVATVVILARAASRPTLGAPDR